MCDQKHKPTVTFGFKCAIRNSSLILDHSNFQFEITMQVSLELALHRHASISASDHRGRRCIFGSLEALVAATGFVLASCGGQARRASAAAQA